MVKTREVTFRGLESVFRQNGSEMEHKANKKGYVTTVFLCVAFAIICDSLQPHS